MGLWEKGNRIKLFLKSGTTYTATIIAKEGSLLEFKDRDGINRAVSLSEIAEIKETGVDYGKKG